MDHREKQRIVRRIVGRAICVNVKYRFVDISVVIRDPSLHHLILSDQIYQNALYELEADGIISRQQSYQLLVERGIWTDRMEFEHTNTQNIIQSLVKTIPGMCFHKENKRVTKDVIRQHRERLVELDNVRNQLVTSTAEYMAENVRMKYLVRLNTQIIGNQDLLNQDDFCNLLTVYYYKESIFSEKILRELARTEPWRIYWTTSKTTGTPLFTHSCSEMTELQSALVSLSRLYDFAYESTNRPSDDVIADDEEFDAWYEAESERLSSESQGYNGSSGDKFHASQEVFIPADREGSKEVYQMNNQHVKGIIDNRNKTIEKHGVVREENMPDVRMNVMMEANKRNANAR